MQFLSQVSLFLSLPLLVLSFPTPILLNRQSQSTENGLSTDTCKAVTFIYARGTSEAGNVGSVAGPPLIAALRKSLGTDEITVQGVEYAAVWDGATSGGDKAGSALMAKLTTDAASKCPDTKLVIGGYSQGAQLVHNSAKTLSDAVSAQITAVVVFGDPYINMTIGKVPDSKVISICHDKDIVCSTSPDKGWTTHLTYGIDAQTASDFIVSKVKKEVRQQSYQALNCPWTVAVAV